MKTEKKFLWKSPCLRWFSTVLACLMLLTAAAPVSVLAYGSEIPGVTESPAEPVPGDQAAVLAPGEPDRDPEVPEQPEAPAEPDTPPREDPQAPGGDETPGGEGQDPDAPDPDAPLPAGPEAPDAEPADPADPDADPDTAPEAPGTQPPEEAWFCPHGGGDSCALCVTGWTWIEDANLEGAIVWMEDEEPEEAPDGEAAPPPEGGEAPGGDSDPGKAKGGRWVLGLPGLGEEPLTWELLLTLLPPAVEVTTASGETKTVPLVWDRDANLQGAISPEGITVTAALDAAAGGYALTPAAPRLEVLVAAGGGEGYAITYPTLWMKFLNDWYFFDGLDDDGNEQNVLDENETITVAINDLQNKTRTQILQWIQDTGLLPKRIGGWVPNDIIPNGQTWAEANSNGFIRLPTLGFIENTKKAKSFEEITEEPAGSGIYKKTEYTSAAQWGSFPIDEWDFINLPNGPYTDGQTITLVARTLEKDGPNTTRKYKAFVNSNDPNDYPDHKDTFVKPDILTLNIKLVNIDPDDHILGSDQIATPENVTVNLFDYWVKTETPTAPKGDLLDKSDNHYHENNDGSTASTPTYYSDKDDWNLGINQDHLLLFGDGLIHAGLWNKGAGENCRYGKKYAGMEGIVKNTLDENGYPEINLPMANKVLTNGNPERKYELIKDYKLAGDHIASDGDKYGSANIKNISNTAIGLWEAATGQTIGDQNARESLNYLFDPTVTDTYKKSYTDVKGLFQISDDGYYYYNMRENFAEFAEGTQTDPEQPGYDPNRFILYDKGATTRTDAEQSIGNFFPFNKGSEVFNTLNADGTLGSTVACSRNTMNHHLGMTVDIDFRQPAGGRINTGSGSNGTPMTFGFSGDDDVWIFIDDVLVLDLGGVHSEIYGTIDFSDGDIYIGQAFYSKGIPEDPTNPANGKMVTHTTLREVYEKAGKADSTQWHGNTFASNTSHKLKMFYLERGNYDSSIALRFNLQPLLHQRVVKVNQNGQTLPNVSFELYEAEEVPKGTAGAIQCLYTDRDVSTNTPDAGTGLENKTFYVKKKSGADRLVELTTDADGSAVFMKDGQYFNFADRGDQYYILEETQEPSGYRKQPVDIVLGYDANTSMLSVANRWTTGAYACSVSNITAAASLNYGRVEDGTVKPDETASVSADDQKNGLVVAIPMMKKRSDNSWMALYGSNLDSFQPVLPEGTGEDAWKKAAAIAILNQAQKEKTADWHLDWDDDNHRLKGTLFDLPGLANRYLLNNSEGDLQMIYGFLNPAALATLGITGANAEERYTALRAMVRTEGVEATYNRLPLNAFKFLSVQQFNRDFRSLIYIPNERRELRVLKIDQDGNPLKDTEFTLYDDQGTYAASGTTDDNGMLVFSPAGDGTPGNAKMEWASLAEGTKYFLEETTAPAGYDRNDTQIPIVVGNYSIYADAGSPEDGVTVMAGAGTLTQTMHQYAASQKVDVTLQDIAAVMQVQESGSFSLTGWRDAKLAGTDVLRTMNLHYKKNNPEGQDYGLHDEDGGQYFAPYFVTDTGYVRTRLRQNWDALTGALGYDSADPDANKENLGDTDLTNLFSMVNMVVVGDRTDNDIDTGSLTISKTLTGPGLGEEDYTRLFRFRIWLTDAAGTPLGDTFEYRFYGDDKTGRIKNGGELLLHHDEAVTILGLPQGTKYTVTETPAEGWFTDPKDSVLSGTIPVDPEKKDVTEAAARFTNSKKPAPPPSSSTTPPGDDDDDDDDDDPSSSGSSGSSASGGSGQPPRKSPDTGDETETSHWAFLSVLFLAGAAAICLARFRRKEDPGAEDDRE